MSSVGSSDSSNNEKVRRNREDYQSNESDLVKKHSKEIRRLNDQHYRELESLKNAYEAKIDDMRKRTSAEISQRDHQYQKEIDDIRGLYRKQLMDKADEGQRKLDTLRSADKSDFDNARAQARRHEDELAGDYQKGMLDQEQKYHNALDQNRQAQADSLKDIHDNLTRHYQTQVKSVEQERNDRLDGLQKSYDNYRHSSEARFNDQDLRHFQEQQRSSNDLLRAVQKERMSKQDSEEYLRQGFNDGLQRQRDRYEKAMSDERKVAAMSRDQLRSTVGDRLDNQVRRLSEENQDLKDGNIRAQLKMEQDKKREVSNISDAYRKNAMDFQNQRDEAVRAANDRTHKKIEEVRDQLEKHETEVGRYYRDQESLQNRIHRKAYDNLKSEAEIRQQQIKDNADDRVKHLYETTSEDKARLIDLGVQDHAATQRSHQEEMKDLRQNLEADKEQAVSALTERMQKMELDHTERMANLTAKYEKEIQMLKDQMAKDNKRADTNLKRLTEELQRQNQMSLDRVQARNRDELNRMNNQHVSEVRELNKRHEEKLDEVVTQMKKT